MLHAIIPSRTVNCGRGGGEVDVSVCRIVLYCIFSWSKPVLHHLTQPRLVLIVFVFVCVCMVTTEVGSVFVFALSQPKLDPYFSHFVRVLAALQ
jgi:hypothetical protein